MPRRKRRFKKKITPDPKYNSVLVARFINHVLRNGKKSLARKIVYESFDIISKKTGKNPISIFEKAIKNVSPVLEVRPRRIGGANYQIPYEVKGDRKSTLAMRWIIEAARAKRGKSMQEKLSSELLEANRGQGAAMKKRENIHKMAIANKAFAHFAI